MDKSIQSRCFAPAHMPVIASESVKYACLDLPVSAFQKRSASSCMDPSFHVLLPPLPWENSKTEIVALLIFACQIISSSSVSMGVHSGRSSRRVQTSHFGAVKLSARCAHGSGNCTQLRSSWCAQAVAEDQLNFWCGEIERLKIKNGKYYKNVYGKKISPSHLISNVRVEILNWYTTCRIRNNLYVWDKILNTSSCPSSSCPAISTCSSICYVPSSSVCSSVRSILLVVWVVGIASLLLDTAR
jgi:hypothetical protein